MKTDKQKEINNKTSIISVKDNYDMLKIAQFTADYDIVFENLHKKDAVKPLEIINQIIYGENLKVLIKMPSNSVHLVYLDPPFFSGSDYQVEVKNGKHKQIIKFEDEWDCDKNEYILRMYQRLKELHRVLTPDGIICLHCDHHASHWLKIIMDHIFGEDKFQTEIIYQKMSGSSFGAKSNKIFPIISENILVYSKGKKCTYNKQYIKYNEKELKESQKYLENTDNDPNGKYQWQKFLNKDTIPSDKLLKLNNESKIKFLKQIESGAWRYKRYWNDTTIYGRFIEGLGKGKSITNIWTDINRLTYINYPTEKPLELLERIILSFSKVGNVILDPFCGGGTSVEAVIKHKRNFIGIDQSPVATIMSANRVSKYNIDPIIPTREQTEMNDVNLMTPWIFQEWSIDKVHGITTNKNPGKPSGGDGGIDGYVKISKPIGFYPEEEKDKLIREKWHNVPISVEKSISDQDCIDSFVGAIKLLNKNIKYGIFISLGYSHTKEKIIKYEDMEILLLTAEDLCRVDKYNFEA